MTAKPNKSHRGDRYWFKNALIKSAASQINWRIFLEQFALIRDEADKARTKVRLELLKRGIISEAEL